MKLLNDAQEREGECLLGVDTIDRETMDRMRLAGFMHVFFSIESRKDSVLALVKKRATAK